MRKNLVRLRPIVKYSVILTFSIYGLTARAAELPKDSRFLSVSSEISDTEKLRFSTLASLAKLSHQVDSKA